ncbi:hypothetical protein AMAG_18123 [Allomyces macrogynus ATCC 38327]|uniref:Uncharacterized protein n=1 Tax=Allomyces macrogynus (strain ATCC 38327) TaxID=578462 RepID=A0A0L0S9B9_ALLM3|nr:hypothetical protein AMAG_18123 [Allomyces macrogynus ATCC 38327]|eukprot:KNE59203.1 hypothetical protein AMAG_18123 [Allomyces macrogynus ATCC 38327]
MLGQGTRFGGTRYPYYTAIYMIMGTISIGCLLGAQSMGGFGFAARVWAPAVPIRVPM